MANKCGIAAFESSPARGTPVFRFPERMKSQEFLCRSLFVPPSVCRILTTTGAIQTSFARRLWRVGVGANLHLIVNWNISQLSRIQTS